MPPTYELYRRLPVHPHLLLPTPLSNPSQRRLPRLSRGQVPHPSALVPDAPALWLAAVLHPLYCAPSESPADSTPTHGLLTWSQVRAGFPLHWVIVQVTDGHTEGTFFLPDHFIVRGTYHQYVDACSYFDTLPPSPTLLLTHTSLARLVLDCPSLP